MATAATVPAPSTTQSGLGLLPASFVAALFILVGVVAIGYGIPKIFEGLPSTLTTILLRAVVQIAAFAGLIYMGGKLAGENPPKGIRGGIFLVIATIITVFFIARALLLNYSEGVGLYIAVGLTAVLVYFAFRLLTGTWARETMIGLEDMGFFHTFGYKRTQGIKMRRYTIIGILLIGLSGVYAMMSQGMLDSGTLRMRIPFIEGLVPVLADANYVVPLLLTAIILWLAWRAVNVPTFADFLIATEAEMNKVSWTPKRRLMQDTVVVLVTTMLLTAFLLVIDLFWGWLLSVSWIGVLPSKEKLDAMKAQEQQQMNRGWEPELPKADLPPQ